LKCRSWIKAACITFFGLDEKEAHDMTLKFGRFGPNIYMATLNWWPMALIWEEKVGGFCGLLVRLRSNKGARPPGIKSDMANVMSDENSFPSQILEERKSRRSSGYSLSPPDRGKILLVGLM